MHSIVIEVQMTCENPITRITYYKTGLCKRKLTDDTASIANDCTIFNLIKFTGLCPQYIDYKLKRSRQGANGSHGYK